MCFRSSCKQPCEYHEQLVVRAIADPVQACRRDDRNFRVARTGPDKKSLFRALRPDPDVGHDWMSARGVTGMGVTQICQAGCARTHVRRKERRADASEPESGRPLVPAPFRRAILCVHEMNAELHRTGPIELAKRGRPGHGCVRKETGTPQAGPICSFLLRTLNRRERQRGKSRVETPGRQ